jgi:hypothetical protein
MNSNQDTKELEEAIRRCEDPKIKTWLQELRTIRGGPWCDGCGSAVVNEGDLCHSCRDGTHKTEDELYLRL